MIPFLRRSVMPVLLAVAVAGCDDDSDAGAGAGAGGDGDSDSGGDVAVEVADEPQPLELPAFFQMEARAALETEDGRTLDCHVDWIWEQRDIVTQTAEMVEYTGVVGGEAGRAILDAEGAGFVFNADAFGETIVRRYADGRVELEVPINEGVAERFWAALAQFNGTIGDDGTMSGSWSCEPFDIDQGGYLDNELISQGSWTAVPVDIEPEPEEEGFEQSVD